MREQNEVGGVHDGLIGSTKIDNDLSGETK